MAQTPTLQFNPESGQLNPPDIGLESRIGDTRRWKLLYPEICLKGINTPRSWKISRARGGAPHRQSECEARRGHCDDLLTRHWPGSGKPHICNIPAGHDPDRATVIQPYAQTNNILLRSVAPTLGKAGPRTSARRASGSFAAAALDLEPLSCTHEAAFRRAPLPGLPSRPSRSRRAART
jgi:hypothetical protein